MAITTTADIQCCSYGYWKTSKKSSVFVPLGNAVTIDHITDNIETKDARLLLSFNYMGEQRRIAINRSDLGDHKLVQTLAGKGADVTKRYFDCFVDTLRIQEDAMLQSGKRVEKVFSHLGWIPIPVLNGEGQRIGVKYCYRAATLPKIGEYNAQVYTDPEIQTAINTAKGSDIFLLVYLGLAVGLRRGELCALKWDHIDLENSKIHITENRVAIKGNVITKQPKSKSSKRTITIGKSACRVLKTAKREYEDERNSYGPGFCKDGYVIHLKDGSPYHPDSLTQKWSRFMAKHNLKHIRLHDLRHSCATSMVANNVDTKTVQKRLGHASYKTTMDLYVHRTQSMDDKAAEIMDQVIAV